jgi:hypothetical protein
MRLNDDKKTLINVSNVCFCRSEIQPENEGKFVLYVWFTDVHRQFIYADEKPLNTDMMRIETALERLESPCFIMPPPTSISMSATSGGQ